MKGQMYIEAIRKQEHESQTRLVAFIKIHEFGKNSILWHRLYATSV